jgi:putative endonuclease
VTKVVIPAKAGNLGFFKTLDTGFRRCDVRDAPTAAPIMKQPCVYLLASRPNGTLYVGVTSDLVKHVWQHKNDVVEGFTKRYRVHRLVWYERYANMQAAIAREKAIKEWKRVWKIELIENSNPEWRDLCKDLL